MSKYTTQVRFICENKSGLTESSGTDDVNNIIEKSWDKIFTTKVKFFDENYRAVLCQKILKHYYLREICCETVGIWKLWMNERLEMIMPYYNKLYESELLDFNPLNDVDITKTENRNISGTEENNGEISGTNEGTKENTSNSNFTETGNNVIEISANKQSNGKQLYSDTPQGSITNLEEQSYLTNATLTNNSDDTNGNETSNNNRTGNNEFNENETTKYTNSETNKTSGTKNTTEDYLETIIGKQSGSSYSKLLKEYRTTFLNIDKMVIDEFENLFFGLW